MTFDFLPVGIKSLTSAIHLQLSGNVQRSNSKSNFAKMDSKSKFTGAVAVSAPLGLDDEKLFFAQEVRKLWVNGGSAGSGKLYITDARLVFVMNENIMQRSAEDEAMSDSPATRGRGVEIRFSDLENFSFFMKGSSTIVTSLRDASDGTEPPARIIILAKGEKLDVEEVDGIERESPDVDERNEYVFEFGHNDPVDLAYEALVMRSENARLKNLKGDTFAINVHCFPKDLQCDMCKFYKV